MCLSTRGPSPSPRLVRGVVARVSASPAYHLRGTCRCRTYRGPWHCCARNNSCSPALWPCFRLGYSLSYGSGYRSDPIRSDPIRALPCCCSSRPHPTVAEAGPFPTAAAAAGRQKLPVVARCLRTLILPMSHCCACVPNAGRRRP